MNRQHSGTSWKKLLKLRICDLSRIIDDMANDKDLKESAMIKVFEGDQFIIYCCILLFIGN